MEFEELIMTPLLDASSHGSSMGRELCYKIDWEPAFKRDGIEATSTSISSDIDGSISLTCSERLPVK